MRKIQKIINHWSASGPSTTMADIRRWHVQNHGWRDIGYHRVILHPDTVPNAKRWSDLVKLGRPLDNDPYLSDLEVGAHTIGLNSQSVGVCVISGPSSKLHPLQKTAIIEVNKALIKRFGLKPSDVYGHREFNKTQCPGDEVMTLIKTEFRNDSAK